MNTGQNKNSPSSSNVNSSIKKIIMESNKQSVEDMNNRKLKSENNPNSPDDLRSYNYIDKKITDLEELISHLQDEITEMSNNLGKQSNLNKQSDPKQIIVNEFENRDQPASNPLLVKDLTLDNPVLSDNNIEDIENDHNFGFKSIRDQFASLWNNGLYDEIDDTQELKDNIMKDIQAQPKENLPVVRDQVDGPSTYNSKETTE